VTVRVLVCILALGSSALGQDSSSGTVPTVPAAAAKNNVITFVQPDYPQLAKTVSIVGKVRAEIIVDESGNVASVKLISGHPILAPAALAAIRKWKYKPFEVDGRPAKVQTEVEVTIPAHVDVDDLIRERKFQDVFWPNQKAGQEAFDKNDLALADFNESLRLEPQSTWTLVTRGNVRKDQLLYDLAIADYAEAIRQDPKSDFAYANRADAYFWKKQYPLAIADATKAIEINPRRWFALAVRGFTLYDTERLGEASADLALVTQLNPKWVKPRYFYAVAEARIEEKAYDSCPKGNRRPNASTTVGGLPVCMKGLEFDTSLRELAEVIRLDPEYADAYAYRGYLYLKLRQRERGIADLRKALALDQSNAFARDTLRSINVAP